MTPLLTLADIQEFKGITSNLNSVKDLDPYILEAMDFDLRPFVGESFYLAIYADFIASPSLATYSDLFNGVDYTYSGKEYSHQGLKAVLAYHAYSRYLGNANVKSTPYGMVNKTTQYSERISEATTARLVAQARSGAMSHQARVNDYLIRNRSTYPLWLCPSGKQYKTGISIKKIG